MNSFMNTGRSNCQNWGQNYYHTASYYGHAYSSKSLTSLRRNKIVAIIISVCYCAYATRLLNDSQYIEYSRYYQSSSSVNDEPKLKSKNNNTNNDHDEENIIKSISEKPPSHIQMCTHLMPRLEHAVTKHNAGMKIQALGMEMQGLNFSSIPDLHAHLPDTLGMEYISIEEDESICAPTDTTKSLLRILSSLLLNIAAAKFELNVEYKHNCHLKRTKKQNDNEFQTLSIQEMLPEDFLRDEISMRDTSFDELAIKNICRDCLNSMVDKDTTDRDNCVLFNRPTSFKVAHNSEQPSGTNGLSIGMVSMLPVIKQSFKNIANLWENEYSIPMLDTFRLHFHPSTTQVSIPESTDERIETSSNEQLSNLDSNIVTSNGKVVIYITCIDEDCEEMEDSIALPFDYYTTKISLANEVSSISIIVSESCAKKVDGCITYGQALFTCFDQLYTEAQIELIQSASSFHVYSQIILADHLICPPSNACFLPAILSSGTSMLVASDNGINFDTFWPTQLLELSNISLSTEYNGKSVTTLDHKFLIGTKN